MAAEEPSTSAELAGLPLPMSLDAVSPNNPVVLEHVSGPGVYANTEALQLAGITSKTPDVLR